MVSDGVHAAQVVEKDAAPETVAAVRESLRQELAQRMRKAANAQALAQARAQAEAHAHSQLEDLLAQKAAGETLSCNPDNISAFEHEQGQKQVEATCKV